MKEAIPLRYSTTEPNEPVELYRGTLRLVQGSIEYEGTGTVSLRWFPSPHIMFDIIATDAPLDDMQPVFDAELQLADAGKTFGATPTGWSRSWNAPSTHTLHVRGRVRDDTDMSQSVDRLRFHLVNFPDFHGEMIQRGASHQVGRVLLEDDQWRVTVDPSLSLSSTYEQLRNEGGYAITHVGILERQDCSTFEMAAAHSELEVLDFFLSLVRGVWTTSCLFDDMRVPDEAFTWWLAPRVDPWEGRISCLPRMIVEDSSVRLPDLCGLFAKFSELWRDPQWNDVLRWLVSWYLASNAESSMDIALLLAEAGLELVASAHARFDMTSNERKTIKRIQDRLDHLLKDLDVNTSMSFFKDLPDYMFTEKVAATEAVIRLRNAVVHADSSRPSPQLRFDASRTARMYLELTLLARLGYNDRYLDRFFGFAEKKVPWI